MEYDNARIFGGTGKHWPKFRDKNVLHNAIQPIILLAQCLGLFPVLGINSSDASGLYFKWFTKQMIYSLFIIIYSIMIDVLTVIKVVKSGFSYYNTVEFVFLATIIVLYGLFIHVARKWPDFGRMWHNVENEIPFYGAPKRMAVRFKIMAIIFMLLAIVEHTTSIITKVVDALNCIEEGEEDEEANVFQVYFVNAYKHIFHVIDYKVIVAFPTAIFTFITSCAWNFMDLFVIVLSIAMSERYKQLNMLLKSVEGRAMPISFWKKVRETYNELSRLTKTLDDLISPIVLLSFANNLYFICLQLLNSLKPMNSIWHAIYFVYSFSYLVLRMTAVSLYAAAIYEQSKATKSVLFSVPSDNYCIEVSRMILQIASDELLLTGCRFFSVTRTLILTVAGTIVTYEIVLVQFNAVNADIKRNRTLVCM